MHTEKSEKQVGELCTLYTSRYVGNPPFTCLSMDSRTFMCNFGCSVVTEDRALIVRHLLESHHDMLERWCMNENLMKHTLKYFDSSGAK